MIYLSSRRLSRRLGVSARLLEKWAESGEFPSPLEFPGGVLRWDLAEVRAWLAERPRHRAEFSELATEILQALEEAADWVSGVDLAKRIGGDVNHTNGTFRKAVGQLKYARRIKTDKVKGYNLTT
jgi:predicted DNA-binding transcriptional regulator AlpA